MKRIGRLLLDAIQGVPGVYTEGPISKAVILLGVPMVVELAMESLFAVTDIFYVRGLGPNAVAAIGLTESLLTFGYAIASGLEMGAMAMISRRIGERDSEGAAVTAVQVLILSSLVSVLIAALGVAFSPQLLKFMGASPALVTDTVPYMRVVFGGNAGIVLLCAAAAIFRAAGDGVIAMRALALSNGLNLLLVPCLVKGLLFFPDMGLMGAAVATTIARVLGALYVLGHLFGGPGRIKTYKRHWIVVTDLMVRILRISAVCTFQIFIGTASMFMLVRVVSSFGTDAIAGYTIASRLIGFALLPAMGLSNAAATMAGQMLGAGKPDRAENAVWLTGLYNLAFLGFIGVLFMIFTTHIVGCFTNDAIVLNYAAAGLRIIVPSFLLYAFGMVLGDSFNAVGDTWTPTWIIFLAFWVFEIPTAWLLSHTLRMGPQGVFLAVSLAFSVFTALNALLFRRGHWKTQPV